MKKAMILLSEEGASVAVVIIMLAVLTAVGVIFVSMISLEIEGSTLEVSSTRALYAAEAGTEAAIGHLKKSPVSTNWAWNSGYLDKAAGSGTVDVEVLQYENRDGTLAGASACEPFESAIVTGVTNPARTVYATLSWSTGSDMSLELYDANVADCTDPTASANLIASSATSDMPEVIRYRMPDASPVPVTYTARVTGTAGEAYRLRIAHPDESGFSSAQTCAASVAPPNTECMRATIALGRASSARREVFSAFSR